MENRTVSHHQCPGIMLKWSLPELQRRFLQRDLPYEALVRNMGGFSAASPTTPAYLTVNSPEATYSSSPTQQGLSPTILLVQRKVLADRAKLFLEGKEKDLMAQMGNMERKTVATWLHDFWTYSFMTTKYWGKGPRSRLRL
ncbi:uncharacterized protein BCR38DRAFT_45855 [Pseudomassariella vexata]|uniref:Uncharacterized protein n=1 Tax=Pseudomassariella vexata TaxID=1141098 RepID=A0A1Y2DNJ4_9PEZI|nr:uncharacterized protein BCR38DRAFT_45855 [Pseudomassariella vexata]ORY60734.1 hypothetical protein BCR38DRAFT_45855 [Pseudomassariella vexata]